MTNNPSLTVFELTQYITQVINLDYRLKDLWVEGEVSNFKRNPGSGHAYFTMKDASSQIKCVMWRTSLARQLYIPTDGERIRAHGKVEVYADGGVYQLYVDNMQPAGRGALYEEFERLKAKLQTEGLFDAAHKRPLPAFPNVIGVVTSPTAAAFQDIQNVLRRRYPLAQVLLSPTLVQGDQAPPQIASAIRALCEDGRAEVILLARGGGSIEDLWAFNDERVARAVYESTIPVVTGVGHEVDFTIVDFVSDLRAPTPSAGAEMMTPNLQDLAADLEDLQEQLEGAMYNRLEALREDLDNATNTLRRYTPTTTIETARQRLDDLNTRATLRLQQQLVLFRERIQNQSRAMNAANPLNLLERGYAIVTRTGDGKRLTRSIDAAEGTSISVRLNEGELRAVVKERMLHD